MSSNGRTRDFGSLYHGSNPCAPTKFKKHPAWGVFNLRFDLSMYTMHKKELHMNNTINILSDLVALKSDTDDSIKSIAYYICNVLEHHNIIFQRIPHTKNKAESIIAGINIDKLCDVNSGLILSGHMDTVTAPPDTWDTPPFSATVSDNKVFGRGVADMKYFIAIVLGMLNELKKQNFPILLIFTGDEESDVYGIQHICDFMTQNNIKPHMAIVGEPTNSEIIVNHNGYCGYVTSIQGRAAHSSNLENGINSIYIACDLISYLQKLVDDYIKLGTTINVGRIYGGQRRNIVPDKTTFEWDVRFATPEHHIQIIESVLDFQKKQEQRYKSATIKTDIAEKICALSPCSDNKIANTIATITNTSKTTSNIATEAGFFANMGIDTVVFGTANLQQAHTANEYIEIEAIRKYIHLLKEIIKKAL